MGKYDDITPGKLKEELLRFARLVQKMDEKGVLLERSPSLLRLLGELRQMLFAYEVLCTGNLVPTEEKRRERERLRRIIEGEEDEEEAAVRESLRIVREALERQKELQDELQDDFLPPDRNDRD